MKYKFVPDYVRSNLRCKKSTKFCSIDDMHVTTSFTINPPLSSNISCIYETWCVHVFSSCDVHVNQLPHAFTPSSGHGQCGCDADKCACDCACDTAFVSGRKEFKYFQPGCECDPNCYNEDYSGVSKGGVCEGSLVAEWYSFWFPNRKVCGSKPASGNLVLSFSLSNSGHLTPPHQLTQLWMSIREFVPWGQSNGQFLHISCGPGGTLGAHTTCWGGSVSPHASS